MARVSMASTLGDFLMRAGERAPRLFEALEEDKRLKERTARENLRQAEDRIWKTLVAGQDQANLDREFNAREADRKADRLSEYQRRIVEHLTQGAADVETQNYRRDTLGETVRHNKAMESVGATRENRLGTPKGKVNTPFGAFFNRPNKSMRSSLLAGPAGATMQAVQGAGVQPVAQSDPDAIGRSKYDDWDQLTAEDKQKLINAGYPEE